MRMMSKRYIELPSAIESGTIGDHRSNYRPQLRVSIFHETLPKNGFLEERDRKERERESEMKTKGERGRDRERENKMSQRAD